MIALLQSPGPSPWWGAGGKVSEVGSLPPVDGCYEWNYATLKTIRHGRIRHTVRCKFRFGICTARNAQSLGWFWIKDEKLLDMRQAPM
jgi:hypothetical protein